jgi:hypothetical protein
MGSDMLAISVPPAAAATTEAALLAAAALAALFTSIIRTGAKQMARLCGFILFREDWALTRDKWSIMWTRQFWKKTNKKIFCSMHVCLYNFVDACGTKVRLDFSCSFL